MGHCSRRVVRGRGRHALEHAVPPDKRVEQRCCDMEQDDREKREGEIEMRVPQQRVRGVALGQERRQPDVSVKNDRIGACPLHGQAEKGQGVSALRP